MLYMCSHQIVTPFVGVWIEIPHISPVRHIYQVTPFVGVWIEIDFALWLLCLA